MRHLFLALLFSANAVAAPAADRAGTDRLWALMQMDEVIEVMREEGLDYGRSLDEDMLSGRGGAAFASRVSAIYDAAAMTGTAQDRFADSLADADIAPMLAFFEAPLGRRIIGLELSARRAMLDPTVEEASGERFRQMREAGDPRVAMLEQFAEVNDLIESNVSGALNSSLAYYRGMVDGGALGDEMGESEILSDVWSQEAEVREDTANWVFSFIALAYQPLQDSELEAYTDFSATPAGQGLNRAIFVAFDQMFVDISHDLGIATARYLTGEEL